MKVILKGIAQNLETSDSRSIEFVNLLKQVPYPLAVESENQPPFLVNLKAYINDEVDPDSKEEWGLIWFEYEKVEE